MRTITTQAGTVLWELDNGRLTAHTPGSPGTWFSAADTYSLAMLLLPAYEEIKRAYEREQIGASTTANAYRAQRRSARVRQQKQLQEGAEGVEYDDTRY